MQAHPIPKSPKTRSAPQASTSTFDLNYLPHPSKTDSNLLILFHGIGDNENNFSNLAKTLQNTLPQTSVLVLRGGKTVPMFPDAYSWWQSFDQLGEGKKLKNYNITILVERSSQESHSDQNSSLLLALRPTFPAVTNPNPTAFLTSFNKLIDYLKTPTSKGGIGWRASCIHLFGFGQGGSAALEGAISWTRNQRRGGKEPSASSAKIEEITKSSNSLGEEKTMEKELGSIVSVSGGLLSVSHSSYLAFQAV